jgi:hypothetical protein
MLKKIIFFIISLLLLNNELYSQKEGFVWCFGKNAGIDFNNLNQTIFNSNAIIFEASASIADKYGNHLFHIAQMPQGSSTSSDCKYSFLINKHFQKLKESDSLKINCSATQGALILPLPESETLLYLFHIGFFEDDDFPICENNKIQRYYYSIIDISKDSGLGEVVSKNNILIDDWATEKMIAIRHGNGRDWWIIMHGINDIFYKILFTSNGIDTIINQNIGPFLNELYLNDCIILDAGQIAASSDGKKIAMSIFKSNSSIDLFSFNRCSGELYNCINIFEDTNEKYYGCEFSPDSKLLYITESTLGKILQFDLSLNDINSSRKEIANTNITWYFGQLKLYNNRIYLTVSTPAVSRNYISTILNPNGLDISCNLEIDAIFLDGAMATTGLPNIPNFNLGPLLGSACDTLSIVQPEDPPEELSIGINNPANGSGGFRVYPNPASTTLYVEIIADEVNNAVFRLYNMLGQNVLEQALEDSSENFYINIGKFKAGFYSYSVSINNKVVSSDRIIFIK